MTKLWLNSSKIVIDAAGKVVLCSTCPCTTANCSTYCSSESSVSVTLGGFVDPGLAGTCDCSDYNGTHGMSTYATCTWRATTVLTDSITGAPCGITGVIFASVIVLGSGNYGWRVDVYFSGTLIATFEWDSGGTAKFDCSATRTLTKTYSHPTHACGTGTLTCQIN